MIASPSFDYIFFKTVIYKKHSDGHESQSRVTETLPRRFEVSPPSSLATSFSIFFLFGFFAKFSQQILDGEIHFWRHLHIFTRYIFLDVFCSESRSVRRDRGYCKCNV